MAEARNQDEAARVAKTIAQSFLVKTALHGGDANWGRILAALGRAGVAIDTARISLYLGEHCVFRKGELAPEYSEAQGAAVFSSSEVHIRILLGQGSATFCAWTADLGEEYVRINADYRS